MDVVCRLFPYTLGEMVFNWYLNLPPASIRDWNSFERFFLEQFKIYVDPTFLYHQFISIKRDPYETISQFNHRFYRMYQRMEFPYTVPQEAAIQIYFGTLDSLTSIFLRRLPPRDIDTIEKVFKEAVTFTNHVTAAPMPTLTYSGYQSQKTIFFEQKAVGSTEAESNMARELKAMKETMSLLSNELIKIKLNSSRNQGDHPRQLAT